MRRIISAHSLAGLLTTLLFALFTLQSIAQTAPDSRAPRPLSFGYDKAHEITLNGVVQDVISERVPGSPVGTHLLVAASQGVVDAHLGAFLSQDTRDALHAGESVEIVGAMTRINGKDYLLARQLIVGGRTITIRTQRGGLVMHGSPLRASSSQAGTNGGAR